MSKNLLSISDLSKKEILDLIEFAKNFKQDDGSFRKENLFPDKTIANVFCEPSTRTKSSFEIAAKNLGCSVVGFDISNSSVEKGESIYETVDALSLMGFLGVGIAERFLPPVQISVVNAKSWQTHVEYNELEANQVQVSSLILLTHLDGVTQDRIESLKTELKELNSTAKIITIDELDVANLPQLTPSENKTSPLEHKKFHWASSSCDLPNLPDTQTIEDICKTIPDSILRVKGVTQLADEKGYTYFERIPSGEINIKPYNGTPTTGTKLLTIGPGSEPKLLKKIVSDALSKVRVETTQDL